MSVSVGVSSAWKNVPTTIAVGVSGAWKTVTDAYVGVGGAWKRVWGLAVSLSTSSLSGTQAGTGVQTCVTSGTVTVNVDGAAAPYSFNWSMVSGDGGIVPTTGGQTTAFQKTTYVPPTGTYNGAWKCTVTDNNGLSKTTSNVNIALTFTG
jgi:hypothetical protein